MEENNEVKQEAPRPAPKPVTGQKAHSAMYVTLAILVVLFLFAQFQIMQLDAKVDILTAMGVADTTGDDAPAVADDKPTVVDDKPTQPSVDKVDVVTIEEYSDFQCPYCARGRTTMDEIKEKYGDKVKIVYKHFPLSFHQNAQKAAEAAECAKDQGMFWEMHDMMFDNQGSLDVDSLKGYAADLGMDTETFNACLDSGEKAADVQADFSEGQRKGVTGTPAFFIEGEKIVGAQPAANFEAVIDKYLN